MSIIKNSIWNLVGYVIPSLVAIPALGYMAHKLGPELFGIYTIAIAVVGYAGIFDMGLTRAITREIAIYRNNISERKKIIASATIFLLALSTLGGCLVLIFSASIVHFLNITATDFVDINNSFKLLALTIPLFLMNQLWIAILEGDEKFKVVNIQKSFSSTFIAGMPALFVIYDGTLLSAIAGLLFSRIISLLIAFLLVRNEILYSGMRLDLVTFKRLIFFGGWITVSNIISPAMVYFDRFIISNMLGARHVAYYSGPSEAIARLGILPAAVGRAIFPKLSCVGHKDELKRNMTISWLLMFAVCAPIVIFGIVFAGDILNLWLGQSYAVHSKNIFIILLVGFLFNALAQVPFTAIQSVGKAKITALLHCIEIIPYFVMLYFFVQHYGLIGVAFAWSIRVIVDWGILTVISQRLLKRQLRTI
ncbi:flippase [Enterobacter bugandensis]|uniref:flippase n=1 Tax=Enterobacter TaxID=547 RepID=UPI0010A5CBF6|nr:MULTISPECIES: flippase [Enterobacter]MBE4990945.1 flippase [Enterobacter cloacae complex sp. P6RS]MCE1393532.1 flippase [Enterobacter bugandensis]MCK6697308.1 flippase [Enterobacter bugandensis]MCK6860675.1 flippase [Enterobacter bugandensis]MCK7065800.1 flippase [Enterobacter bugandensis]